MTRAAVQCLKVLISNEMHKGRSFFQNSDGAQWWKWNILDIPTSVTFWNSCLNSHFQWLLTAKQVSEIIPWELFQQLPASQRPFAHTPWHTEQFLINLSHQSGIVLCLPITFLFPKIKNPNRNLEIPRKIKLKKKKKSYNHDETKLFYVSTSACKWLAHNRQVDRIEMKHSFWMQMFQKWMQNRLRMNLWRLWGKKTHIISDSDGASIYLTFFFLFLFFSHKWTYTWSKFLYPLPFPGCLSQAASSPSSHIRNEGDL